MKVEFNRDLLKQTLKALDADRRQAIANVRALPHAGAEQLAAIEEAALNRHRELVGQAAQLEDEAAVFGLERIMPDTLSVLRARFAEAAADTEEVYLACAWQRAARL